MCTYFDIVLEMQKLVNEFEQSCVKNCIKLDLTVNGQVNDY